jgi:hypothetical protein
VVVSFLATLVVSGGYVVVVASETRTALKSLMHLWLGAGATSEVSVTTASRKWCGAGGEIVLRKGGEAARRIVRAATVAPGEAHQVVVARRVERRCVGGHPMVSRETTLMLCGLPVDGLEAVLELRRRTELPFADDGPNDGAATDGRGEYNEDHNGGVGEAGSTNLTIVCAG